MIKSGMIYNRGDIVLVPFIYSDLSSFKFRPALILSNNLVRFSDDKICCLVTSKSWPGDVLINKNDLISGSLPIKSFVRPEVLLTVNSKMIKRKICSIKPLLIENIVSKINDYLSRT